jgi:hypothetical protein
MVWLLSADLDCLGVARFAEEAEAAGKGLSGGDHRCLEGYDLAPLQDGRRFKDLRRGWVV